MSRSRRALSTALTAGLLAAALLTGCDSSSQDSPSTDSGYFTNSPPSSAEPTAPPSTGAGFSSAPPLVGSPPTTPETAVASLVAQLGSEVVPAADGTALSQATFSQCSFEYDTERNRTARSLVLRGGSTLPTPALAIEAVSYVAPDVAELAVTEIRTATETCPGGQTTYTELTAEEQQGLTADRVAKSYTQKDATLHYLVLRRGSVVVVVWGTDTVVADATARTMTLFLESYAPAAVGE